jgi:hypothetical protein
MIVKTRVQYTWIMFDKFSFSRSENVVAAVAYIVVHAGYRDNSFEVNTK